MKTENMTTLDLRNSIGQSPLRFAFLLIPLVFACFALSTPSAQAQRSAPKPTIAGNLHPDGTIGGGSGFTSQHLGPGQYLITFPANTWNGTTFPIVVATPIGVVGPVNLTILGYVAQRDGSLIVQFDNSGVDVNFFFIVTQS